MKYLVEDGGIVSEDNNDLLYDACGLEHLDDAAKARLAELHCQDDGLAYEAAEKVLIDEGLFKPTEGFGPDGKWGPLA